jgi:hypothetical protein
MLRCTCRSDRVYLASTVSDMRVSYRHFGHSPYGRDQSVMGHFAAIAMPVPAWVRALWARVDMRTDPWRVAVAS